MPSFRQITLLLLNLVFLTGIGFAQVYYPSPSKSDINDPSISAEERQRRAEQAQYDALRRQKDIFNRARKNDAVINPGGKNGNSENSAENAENEAKAREIAARLERINRMLVPPDIYYQKFADKLKDKKWRLARIFVKKNCHTGKMVPVKVIERCAEVPPVEGDGSFYSFRFRNNYGVFKDWWDIRLSGNKFMVGNEIVQAVIAKVGDIDPAEADKLPETKFLSEYKPKKNLAQIKEQAKLLENGFSVNGFTYFNQAPVELNQTYVLRFVAYLLKGELFNHYGAANTGIDALISFKVVGQEKDGSLIVLWKELRASHPRHNL